MASPRWQHIDRDRETQDGTDTVTDRHRKTETHRKTDRHRKTERHRKAERYRTAQRDTAFFSAYGWFGFFAAPS